MATTSEQYCLQSRIEKLEVVRALGINPYPHNYKPNINTQTVLQRFEANSINSTESLSLAGRVVAYRNHGGIVFAELMDSSGKIQLYFKKDELDDKQLLEQLDLGDFIGVRGNVFRTRRGETTIAVRNYTLLTKTLIPLPDKWHGIVNNELKSRRRSEYLATNPDAREVFVKRSRAITAMREYLDSRGFLEMETPLLQQVYGGASARPFETHVNALGQKFFLSISPELYLKRMIAAGIDRVYTICKNFRNEGIDRIHNPEFTMMECYQSYADYNDMMELTENMYAYIFNKVLGKTKISYSDPESDKGEMELNFTPPWKRVKMLDKVREDTGIEVEHLSEEGLRERISKLENEEFFRKTVPREDLKRWNWGELVGGLFSYFCESSIVQPTFVIDHPKETTPLCKIHRMDERLIERFEPFVYGWEIGNAYSELNDPIKQRSLLEEQLTNRKDDEIPEEIDEDFLRAIEFGIPPTGGLGLGVDRLVMFLTNSYAIKDVIFFPLLRREESYGGKNDYK